MPTRETLLCRFWMILVMVSVLVAQSAHAADWPMWRRDAARTAVTDEQLADQPALSWWRDLGPNHVAWSEDVRLQFDASYQPVVAGQLIYVASSRNDSVTAFDTRSGAQKWQFFADGPVRLAPVIHAGRIYFGADDGFFYCLDAISGEQIWRHNAALGDRRVLGNERLVSVWPVRGGPVLVGSQMFFAAGVWAFEGTLDYQFTVSPESLEVPAFKTSIPNSLSPQGYLVASGGRLFFPGGRATVGSSQDGQPMKLDYDARGRTDWHASASDSLLFHGGRVYDVEVGKTYPVDAPRPVARDGWIYTARTLEDDDGNVTYQVVGFQDTRQQPNELPLGTAADEQSTPEFSPGWEVTFDNPDTDQPDFSVGLVAGNRLYGHFGRSIFAIDLPETGAQPEISWRQPIDGTPSALLAADKRLFLVTAEGRLCCFADADGTADAPQAYPAAAKPPRSAQRLWDTAVSRLVEATDKSSGYCVALGIGSGQLIDSLLDQTDLQIVAIDSDPSAVQRLRHRYAATGDYGVRLSALVSKPLETALPPYMADLIVMEDASLVKQAVPEGWINRMFNVLRPYGGTLALFGVSSEEKMRLVTQASLANLPGSESIEADDWTLIRRAGALPGSADWTHEYADTGNTLMSQDQLVKAPLGVLWYGGPASRGEHFFNRHYWGPSLKICAGRMFLQGPGKLTAVDVYTGRILWTKELPEGTGAGRRGNFFEVEKPGYHYAVTPDALYLAIADRCLKIDPATGAEKAEFSLPNPGDQWGDLRIWNDLLITTIFQTPAADEPPQLDAPSPEPLPQVILAIDRQRGDVVWSKKAQFAAPLLAIGGKQLYYFDGLLDGFYDAWSRQGRVPDANPARYLVALDAATGEQAWVDTIDRVVTWLSYSDQHDLLIASNKTGIDVRTGSTGKLQWTKESEAPGFGGHPENVWDKVILWKDWLIDQRGPGLAYDVKTGAPVEREHPLSGERVPWEFTKTGHHCNYAIANPHLLTFRAHTAGFCDIESGNTGRLNGFRSGCRNSLIPANGVLNAPNYAHGCSCSFNLFTSLALVHVPNNDFWSYSALRAPTDSVRRLGINFGAPGHRQHDDGTLWLNYPVTHKSFNDEPVLQAQVEVTGDSPRWFRLNSSQIDGTGPTWVAASGVEGLSSIAIELPGDQRGQTFETYLVFCEPSTDGSSQRLFDVEVQGKVVKASLNVAKEAGGVRKPYVLSAGKVEIDDRLLVELDPVRGQPLICGVHLVAVE